MVRDGGMLQAHSGCQWSAHRASGAYVKLNLHPWLALAHKPRPPAHTVLGRNHRTLLHKRVGDSFQPLPPPQRRGCIGTTSQPEPWCPETQAPCKTGYERVPSTCSGDTGRLSCHRNDASVSQHLLNTTAVPCGSENGSVRAICGWHQCVQTCSDVNRQSQPHLHGCRCRNHLAIHRKPLAFVPLRCHQ